MSTWTGIWLEDVARSTECLISASHSPSDLLGCNPPSQKSKEIHGLAKKNIALAVNLLLVGPRNPTCGARQ